MAAQAILQEQIRIGPQEGPQTLFLSTPADIAVYGGAAGGGKTFALLLEGLRNVHVPGFGAVIFRRTFKQITDEGGIWATSDELYPLAGAKPNLSSRYWEFHAGTKIGFAGLETEASKYNWQGAQICYLGFDELTHFTKAQFFYLLSRNRSKCGVRPYVRASTNPGEGWVKELLAPWVNPDYPNPAKSGELRWMIKGAADQILWVEEGTPNAISVTFVAAKLSDNAIFEAKDPEYRSKLELLDEYEREQLLYGNWSVQRKHRVISGFDEKVHVRPYHALTEDWKMRAVGADFGSINAAEMFLAEDPQNGDLYIFNEDWPGEARSTKAIADKIRELCGCTPKIGCGGNKTIEQGWVEAYGKEGIPMVLPEFRDVAIQYQCVNDEFRANRLYVMSHCTKTIAMLNTFQRDLNPDGTPKETFDDTNFHLLAALRYIVSKLRPPKQAYSFS